MLKAWLRDESGQAMAEYGLLIALLVVGVSALAILFRDRIGKVIQDATTALGNAEQNAAPK